MQKGNEGLTPHPDFIQIKIHIVRRHGRLGSAIVRVGVRNLRGTEKGEQDARRGAVFDL